MISNKYSNIRYIRFSPNYISTECSPNSNCSISKLSSVPKQALNVIFVPLIASSHISKEISCKMRIAITRTPLYIYPCH